MIDSADLLKQFDRRLTVSFGRNRIGIIDVAPRRRRGLPVALVSGWATTAAVMKDNIIALAASGRRVIYAEAPHGIEADEVPGYPATALRKAAALLLALDERRIRRADIVAHSEGAIVAAVAATLAPKRFRSLVLVSPAGLAESKDFNRLAKGFSADALWNELRRMVAAPELARPVLTAWLEGGRAIAADPWRSYEEAQSISKADIAGMLHDLRQKGIGLAVIHAESDSAFPVKEVCRRVASTKACPVQVVPGNHFEFYFRPAEFAERIGRALDALAAGPKE